ncbi:uncharacterized protein [Zea mays]|uniref:uncharacterized protein n=1 Tax=Zea mays TaxID=4577 RepID=UPI000221CA2F|nr:uncharacterized protein LOC103626850 [Zea mays]|eukprot:XP_008645433.1 uncharacterized protein LOC103626850 [Zea mays]
MISRYRSWKGPGRFMHREMIITSTSSAHLRKTSLRKCLKEWNGVTTIDGGKSGRGGHVDGPSGEAKFSNDFEVHYIGSS